MELLARLHHRRLCDPGLKVFCIERKESVWKEGIKLAGQTKYCNGCGKCFAGQFIHKYTSYAREHDHPRMSRVAADILKGFYLGLRKHSPYADGTPITARQLESLVRLAEACARVDLREEVTVEDAQDQSIQKVTIENNTVGMKSSDRIAGTPMYFILERRMAFQF